MTFKRCKALHRLNVKHECRHGSHLSPRRCSRERNPIGCDGVEDNKPSPKNARMRIYRNLRARRFLCVSPQPRCRSESSREQDVHLGVSRSHLRRPRETRAESHPERLEAHLCISESETPFAPDSIGRFCRSHSFADFPLGWENFCCCFCRFWTVKKWGFLLLLILTAYKTQIKKPANPCGCYVFMMFL